MAVSKRDSTGAELWCEVCAAECFDECEPWQGFRSGPKKISWNFAAGGDRDLYEYWQKLVDHWKAPIRIGSGGSDAISVCPEDDEKDAHNHGDRADSGQEIEK